MRRAAVLVFCVLTASACVRVAPHQRETLAKRSMQQSPWPAVERVEQHVLEVREGSSGANGEAGGGCGCN